MPVLVDVEATVDAPDLLAAPTIRFSFPGSSDLEFLWGDLAAIGWEIPELPLLRLRGPSRLGTGRNRGKDVRVENFLITAPTWPADKVAIGGLETMTILRRHGVDVHMPATYVDFLRQTQRARQVRNDLPLAAQAAATLPPKLSPLLAADEPLPVRNVALQVTAAIAEHSNAQDDGPVITKPRLSVVPNSVVPDDGDAEVMGAVDLRVEHTPPAAIAVDPSAVSIPNVIMLSEKPWSVLELEPGVSSYRSVVVPGRTRWTWSETSHQGNDLGHSLPDPRILFETVEFGWQRSNEESLDLRADPETQRSLWFIVSQFDEANNVVKHLVDTPEVTAQIIPLDPLPQTNAFDGCYLVSAVVPTIYFATLGASVVSTFPDVIARGKPTPPIGSEEPFRR